MLNFILGAVLPFVLLVIAGYLIKVYKNNDVIKWVNIAVKAAEQIYNEAGMGKEKFSYVSEFIKNKFKISDEILKNLIESAVYEINKAEGKNGNNT